MELARKGIGRITAFLNKWVLFLNGTNQGGFGFETGSVHYEVQSKFYAFLRGVSAFKSVS
jgi:hypothetical protein